MKRISFGSTRAFTLIELLIVVAIISILAAIAVPNFLEAQTRSKTSRAKADMRSLAVAIESYAVDNNRYPIVADDAGERIMPYPGGGPEFFETRISTAITTPIAYITARLREPFPTPEAGEDPQFHYSTRKYATGNQGAEGEEEFIEYLEAFGGTFHSAMYFIVSHGPDLDHDAPEGGNEAKAYDPTNGTISDGDIIYVGPGIGFR